MLFLAPFSCIYYPLETLPVWMQWIAQYLSTTYVFEGMRALIIRGEWCPNWWKPLFNAIYFILGLCAFCLAFRSARRRGMLLQSRSDQKIFNPLLPKEFPRLR